MRSSRWSDETSARQTNDRTITCSIDGTGNVDAGPVIGSAASDVRLARHAKEARGGAQSTIAYRLSME
ncbi:hypothetical protein [Lysobacter firmicutimachus]|uniref:Uncharacterized protein n=1 Tax=Lysobacter firmicutimachus TaxID=1792846 RepID=A0ABU8CXF4_9GAMM